MAENNWGTATSSYSTGTINFTEFAERTSKERRGWVSTLRRKLSPIPAWHSDEDSEQDFLLDLYLRAKTFDPARSSSGGYFRHGIHNVGKRIQKARGVEQHRRKSEPRFEKSFSSLGVEIVDLPDNRTAEAEAVRSQYYEILRQLCETPAQLAVICALQAGGGNLAGATAHLFSDEAIRRALALQTERDASQMIDRVVKELIVAYGTPEEEKEARA